jgi:hypothetical protein
MILLFTIFGLIILWGWERRAVTQGTILGVLALLLFYTWGTGWWVSKHAANDTRERWITEATDKDVYSLVSTLQEVSWLATGSENGLEIVAAVDSKPLQWYHREYDDLQFVPTVPRSTHSDALITNDDDNPVLASDYLGVDFAHIRPQTTNNLTTQQAARWWFFHESPLPVIADRVILWIRADITGVTDE